MTDNTNEQRNTPPNCYECKYRGNLPGDAHSCCHHPKVTAVIDSSMGIFGIAIMLASPHTINTVARDLNIMADPHGIRSGWFVWPVNFDPGWLKACSGFVQK